VSSEPLEVADTLYADDTGEFFKTRADAVQDVPLLVEFLAKFRRSTCLSTCKAPPCSRSLQSTSAAHRALPLSGQSSAVHVSLTRSHFVVVEAVPSARISALCLQLQWLPPFCFSQCQFCPFRHT
jgi:hypothetical protein